MMRELSFGEYPHDGRVYSVLPLTEGNGFYVCDGDPIYAAKICDTASSQSMVETECLQLRLGVRLRIVGETCHSETQRFDMIRLTKYGSEKELIAFTDLCTMHAQRDTSLTFEDFFNSLNDLFRPLREQRRLNAMGLYGELAIIDRSQKPGSNLDFSRAWQLAGDGSKYDFSFHSCNLEIKSTTSRELKVQIKHFQLFNEDSNFLIVVALEKTPNGESLRDLAARLLNSDRCFVDLRSQTELARQMLRTDEKSLDVPYLVRDIRCFSTDEIDFINDLSDRVTDLSYCLDLVDLDYVSWDNMVERIVSSWP
ncbi:PD-(D/E)XK motif protein [Paratractidigestivibacter sp.]|uniref:PD-(D/E)XK motif protein n=1 Tax=Paratractidigestivibacter sp. TaxID=2847316 RepID=UPI002ACB16FC|nr:PD-(D/E)XK motif protein [Paratractidigestivibacter sp.]